MGVLSQKIPATDTYLLAAEITGDDGTTTRNIRKIDYEYIGIAP